MKILLCSVPFRPSTGGIETVSAVLAEQFHRRGHAVTLVTQTPAGEPDYEPYPIVRRPSTSQMWRLVKQADVVFHNNISLRMAWPLLALRRPWVVAHHTWIPRRGPAGRLKRALLRFATNLSVSNAIARDLPVRSVVVRNPYRSALFRRIEGVARTRPVMFLGRLVSDKGAALLLHALDELRRRGLMLEASIVGDGPEGPALRALAEQLGLGAQVAFAGGSGGGEDLVRLLNQHCALVVPSVWEEPFGVVVLEGLACGCVPVVARSGGLPEAAGPVGRVFAKGDAHALADALASLFGTQNVDDPLPASAEHLSRHRPERVALDYLDVLTRVHARGLPLAA
jgi:glycogen synthase